MSTTKKITYVCEVCGSDDICCDATARWDIKAQEWLLSGVQDASYCDGDSCCCEREIVEKEL